MKLFTKLLDAIASVIFCKRFMSWKQAVKRPIQIPHTMNMEIDPTSKVFIDGKLKPYMIKLGFIGAPYISANQPFIHLGKNSVLHFKGDGIMGNGICIYIEDNAEMIVGNNFYCNCNCTFRCSKNQKIKVADDVLFGWNIMLNTTDGHEIEIDGVVHENNADIEIGYHTWVASDTIISKGVSIPDECIVAQRSLVNKSFTMSNSLIAGIPAKVVRSNVKRND